MPRRARPATPAPHVEPDAAPEPDIMEEIDAMVVAATPEGDVYDVPTTTEGPYTPSNYVRRMVARLKGCNTSDADIARLLRLSLRRLRLHYLPELETGSVRYSVAVAAKFHDVATDPSHPQYAQAAMFWLERVAGWRKVSRLELSSGNQSSQMPVIDSRKLTPEQREQLRELLAIATAPDPQAIQGPAA